MGKMSVMKKKTKIILIVLLAVFLCGAGATGVLYHMAFGPSVTIEKEEPLEIFIYHHDSYEDLFLQLEPSIRYPKVFDLLSKHKGLRESVKAGHYTIPAGTSNNELINRLISGNQQPVKVNFNSLRTMEYLSEVLAWQLEPDSMDFISLFRDTAALMQMGIHPDSLFAFLLPDTYEFYWTSTPEDFLKRMKKEAAIYWDSREALAEAKDLTPWQVISLAAIVERETQKNDEKATIAGVYLNRLEKNMKLQADPTVVYAVGDFTLRRVLKKHTKLDHPYNTYKYRGLPPGPICVPSKASIEAVLHAEDHNYIYFCAREDMSGYHSFARTYSQHLRNARKFQHELNKRGIK